MDTKVLRQKILDLAIRGKLVPQDPNDEPASVLLERIREEKQQMLKDGKLKPKDVKNDTIIFRGEDNSHYEKFQDGTVKCIEDEIPFDVPEGWAWERLSNLASFSGGKTPSTSRVEYWNGDILWVTSKDMKSKYIISSQLRLSTLGAEQMQIYQPNTLLLVTRSGILRHSLPVSILKECATINQDLKAIVLYMPQSAEYIYLCLKGMEPQLLLKYTKSGTTVENVNFDKFQKVLLPIAPIQQIDRIITATNNATQLISTVEDGKVALDSYLAKLKSKILDLAIRGKLVPQDPNDEPASILLERIKTEKEELIKQGKIKRDKKESIIFRGDDNSYYLSDDSLPLNMPFVIPEHWTWCTLQELCNYGDCINISSENIPANAWILELEDIEKDSGKVIQRLTNCQRPSTSVKHKFSKNMVLYSRLRPYLNKVILADADGYCSSEILPLKFAKEIYPRYAQIFLMSPFFVEYASLCSYGMKMPRLGTKDGQRAYFALPPYEEQLKIAYFVDSLFYKLQTIENNIT